MFLRGKRKPQKNPSQRSIPLKSLLFIVVPSCCRKICRKCYAWFKEPLAAGLSVEDFMKYVENITILFRTRNKTPTFHIPCPGSVRQPHQTGTVSGSRNRSGSLNRNTETFQSGSVDSYGRQMQENRDWCFDGCHGTRPSL